MRTPTHQSALVVVLALASPAALAQRGAPTIHVPPSVLMEVSALEAEFQTALSEDCAVDRCFSKGCSYVRHATVDQPRSTSLPGLPATDEGGIGSVPAQEYLTQARCEFGYEKSTNAKDAQGLSRRLEQRLSRGWLRVSVGGQALEPVAEALAEAVMPPTAPAVAPTPAEEPPPPAWNSDQATRELWLSVVPHVPWMIAIVLLTLATCVLVWAGRRLGAKSLDEKMLEAQLQAPLPAEPTPPASAEPADKAPPQVDEDSSFAEQQEKLWTKRMAEQGSPDDDDMIHGLLREWLKAGEFPMLARALFVFGDRLSGAFTSDPELALKKVEFAEYFRDVDESTLPSRAAFFRQLNQHAMSSLLLSQDDVQLYRSLREEFGSTGVVDLMEEMPPRMGALFYALIPKENQLDVANMMPASTRISVAEQLLASTRISKEESAYLFSCIAAARNDQPLPPPVARQVSDRGPSLDGATALSVLLPLIPAASRSELFAHAFDRQGGSTPQWYDDVLFGEMLDKLTPELRNDLLLDVDVRALAAWLSVQNPAWRQGFVQGLAPSLQNALKNSGTFASRSDQQRLAKRGHHELVKALKVQYARGRVHFHALVA